MALLCGVIFARHTSLIVCDVSRITFDTCSCVANTCILLRGHLGSDFALRTSAQAGCFEKTTSDYCLVQVMATKNSKVLSSAATLRSMQCRGRQQRWNPPLDQICQTLSHLGQHILKYILNLSTLSLERRKRA